ncbi:hypothetical protein QYE76_058699 [Lolium multiflorum]|uniref:Uncharacterized protein n=1 Tax=Lolium multiflorum TaxID=4521 RepID=A0AAD8WSN8_LOLMU|nr:hypothetical protein QYE76_058699 [Lolium multiflorum]
MEKLLFSAVTGALGPVLGKLGALLGEEYKLVKEVRGKIMFLEAEVEAMHAFLLKMSRVEEPDEQARCWMKDVRELSYDIHNSIDDFMLRVDNGESGKPKGFKGFIKRSVDLLTKTKTRRRIGKEVRSLETLVKEVAERRGRYKIDDNVSKASNATVDPRVCAMYKDLSELVGIAGPTAELVNLLNSGVAGAPLQQLKVVSIVGFGGLGKTTLARHVYDTHGKEFHYRAFVSVSRNPDVVMVLRSILMQVGYHGPLPKDAQCLIDAMSTFLHDKRYFIVVDDVWDVQTWNIIKCAFSKSSCSSRIITTTRVSEVAKACSISYGGDVYNLRPLSIVDSEWLFLQRIFGSPKECPPHLKRVSDKILKKCGGLPLAIISISGLLATNSEEDQWEQVQKSIGHGLGSNPGVEGMMRILSFSYFDLSPCLKSCLLYLSVFPEDADIWKDDLVRRWIWEGIIPEENGQTLYELGEVCFNELINRSLIHPTRRMSDGKVMSFRVHDLILDFVIAKSKEQNFVTLLGVPGVNPDPQMKARRLSLQSGCKIPTGLDLSKARSLVCFGVSFNMPSLLVLKNLRVLEFYECPELEDHHVADIGNLCHLKHLRFERTGITKFPEQIVELKFLETLEIFTRGGEEGFVIPSTLCQLQRLTHLVIPECTILPDEIGSMQALQVLEGINVFPQSSIFCQQLGQLTNLRTLRIQYQEYDVCDNIEGNIKETVSSICKLAKTNLYDLYVSGGYGRDSLFDAFNIEDFLDESCLFALQGLRTLDFDCHVAPRRIPTSMSLLANLQALSIMMLVINQEGMEILGGLPALRRLSLDVEKAGPEGGQIRISSLCGFHSLTNFRIGSYNCILRFIFEAGSMPKLQTLRFIFSETDQLDFGIQHLSSLTYMSCYCRGANGANTRQQLMDPIEREIEVHPNNPTLEWTLG